MVRRFGLRADSGGEGRFRGGLGAVREYESLTDGVQLIYRGERHSTRARGSQGGGDGASSRAVIYRSAGAVEEVRSKMMTTLNKGDRLVLETAGGGGFGPPSARDADAEIGRASCRDRVCQYV